MFFKKLSEWSICFKSQICFILFPKGAFLRTSPRGPIGRVLSLPCIIPQRRVPKNSLSGSHWFEWLSSPCLINLKFTPPPLRPIRNRPVYWVGGWAVCKNMQLAYALTYETPGKFRNSRIFLGAFIICLCFVCFIPALYFWRPVAVKFSGNKGDSDFLSGLALVLVGLT